MNESNSIKTVDKTNLAEETKFRLDKIGKIENIFMKKSIKEYYPVKN